MPGTNELVTLVVDGSALIGWQDVSVDRSAESAEISFNLGASNPSWSPQAKSLRYGKQVRILTAPIVGGLGLPGGGDLLCDGHVDGYGADYEPGSKKVTVDGKSKGADAVDCHPVKHKTGRIENKTILDAAKELDEVKCGWSSDIKLDRIPKIQRQPGDTIFQTIEREVRRIGAMLVGQPDGSIKITRAGTKRHAGALVMGQSPVESMGVKLRTDQKFSPIVGRGQRTQGTKRQDVNVEERETDPSVTRHKPLLILPEGDWSKKELKKRLGWERLRRAQFGTTIRVKVNSWRDAGGRLWEPGYLVPIVLAEEDIDSDYAISTVNFRQGFGEGTVAYLTLTDPKAQGGKAGAGKSDKAFDAGAGLDD